MNKKKWMGLGLCWWMCATLWGQNDTTPIDTISNETAIPDVQMNIPDAPTCKPRTTINFGVKGGFTSTLFLIPHFSVNGTPITEVQNNYKIGYFGSVFMRVNFGRHFLQPEISYNVNRCNITFDKPTVPKSTTPEESSINSSIHSIDIPMIYGYNFIKEGPYSLGAFIGPKIRCILAGQSNTKFENFDQLQIQEVFRPINLSATIGVAVTISRIFFDFRYDISLHNITKKVTYEVIPSDLEAIDPNSEQSIYFHQRDNVLSFSLGVFF